MSSNRLRVVPEENYCVVRDREGLKLRSLCDECTGAPTQGYRRLRRGQLLCVEGEDGEYVFPVIEGFLKESCTLEDGRIQGIRLVSPGDVVGLEAMLGERYHSTIEAVTPARVCSVTVSVAERTLGADAKQGAALSRMLTKQVNNLRRNMLLLGSMSAEERTVAILKQLAGNTPTGVWIKLPMTRRELAELLGLSLSTVSRIVQRLAREGVLDVSGRMVRFRTDAPVAR